MARTRTATTQDPALVGLLDAARAETAAVRLAEARRFELASAWAEAHPAPAHEIETQIVDDAGVLVMYGDRPLTIAGEGAPQMAEFAVEEFARACGLSTYAGRALIGAAVEAKHRLPRIWARAIAGEVAIWKVRKVTEHTHRLTPAGAAHVDHALHRVVGSCSFAQVERAVAAAEAETDPGYLEDQRLEPGRQPYVSFDFRAAPACNGRVPFHGLLEYPDALALDKALQARAAELDLGPDFDLDQRRAAALTDLLTTSQGPGTGREVVVYAHYNPADRHDILEIEKLGAITLEQVYAWCRSVGTKVTLKPVIDLDEEITVATYRPSEQLKEQVILTCPTCVFPGCTRTARACDLDHITPWSEGGATTSWNLAPLCRLHHRMKTHGHWTYQRLTRVQFEWTSPEGRTEPVDLTHKRRRTR